MVRAKGFHPWALALLPLTLFLPTACSGQDKSVAIVRQSEGVNIVISAKLTDALDVTITLNCDLENLQPTTPLPVTVDSDGKSDVPLVTLRVIDRTRPYKYGYHVDWKPGGRQKAPPKPYYYALPYSDGPYRVRQGALGRFSHSSGSQDEQAIDFSMPVGTKVTAARAGIVVASRADVSTGGSDLAFKKDYNYIVIRHEDGTYAEYLHLDKGGVLVRTGDKVTQGQEIGLSGATGYTSGPHLHFAVFNTVTGKERRTIPIEFELASGKHVALQEGRSY